MTEPADAEKSEPVVVAKSEQTVDVTAVRPKLALPVWAIALIVAVVAVGGFFAIRALTAGTPEAGECASVTGNDDKASVSVVDCGADDATHKISLRQQGECPAGGYREVQSDDQVLCMVPNFVEGKCYEADDDNAGFKLSGCDNKAAIKINKVITGSTDASECPRGNGVAYPEPPTLYCLDIAGA